MGYEIAVNSGVSETSRTESRYTVTDRDGVKMHFNGYGNLIKIVNPVGVATSISYDVSNRISTITDGAGRVYTFGYASSSSSTVTSITDPASRVTRLSYSGSALAGITFPDGKCVSMGYNSAALLTSIDGIDTTSATDVVYDLTAISKPVSSISAGNSASILERYTFAYSQNETTVTELTGRNYTYQFNDYGQTTGAVSNWDGHAQFFEFAAGNSTDAKANKLLSESKVQYAAPNQIVNSQFSSNINGYSSYTTVSSYTQAWDGGYGHAGDGSYKVGKSSSGTVYGIQYIDVSAGTYTLSGYMSTKNGTLNGTSVLGVEVWVGSSSCEASYRAESISSCTGLDKWERRAVTFTVDGDRTLRVLLGVDGSTTGTVWFDDIQLESGYSESSFNLLENAGLTNGTNYWTLTNGEISDDFGTQGFENGIRLAGVPTAQSRAAQSISVSGNEGDVFSFGAWVYAVSAPTNGTNHGDDPNPVYQVALTYYNDGTQVGQDKIDANSEVPHTQFICGESIAPAAYTDITYEFIYDYNINYGYYRGGYCYKEQYGQTYTYDEKGNVTSVVDLAEAESQFEYNGSLMTKLINPSGSSYEYTYNDTKQLTSATSSDGQTYAFTYDNKGNILTSAISAGTSQTITSSAGYTTSKNFMSSLTDQRGNTTTYTYDENRGTLLTATDPKGTKAG